MTDPDLATILPDALARETLAMPNTEAWAAMDARLAAAGVRCAGQAREAAWAIRRQLQVRRVAKRQPLPSNPATEHPLRASSLSPTAQSGIPL